MVLANKKKSSVGDGTSIKSSETGKVDRCSLSPWKLGFRRLGIPLILHSFIELASQLIIFLEALPMCRSGADQENVKMC